MTDIVIGPLHPAQVPAAQRLLTESFDERLQPYMTATQAGAEAFLLAYVSTPQLHPERQYLGATLGDELVGYAEFRQTEPQVGFLSYICVSPLARGQGVASRLIRHYLAITPGLKSMALDVFADNVPALTLYRKLGFQEQAVTLWWRRPLPEPAPTPVQMLNWPAALAMYQRYGFCEYQIRFEGEKYVLGRMGETVLRCTQAADFANERLLAALRAAFPALQQALLIAPEDAAPHADAEAFNRSLRLHWTLPESQEDPNL
ncbi:GCN5-related N-acetyltransferase (plasmid) [Deinococcus proteolyticus MRP]|uniref:GCN5-related N-acetyltransferase n=1 Tax=Deinococcus proteolyticus (strain ATCC 35074 / DSM 20540 / JCM 6276 / NBRC 101906 / NCIMB 13154 / VKM Ac-1939 / CCM 2703 / MRP) TaxID=693977 RepID=F0RPZ1_DEIPM|nr:MULTISPECIES: GNAT family N-acetyltransferase [Deinococcus]ADY27193.1 GCN5-related N-acetyltransferase [Deinococcus proteolyticus MRP]MCY1704063.1 GNAT family N-acetyltransferase [Deinococcus sp. SL84]